MTHAVHCLNPPPEIDPRSVAILGISTTNEVLFSALAVGSRSARDVTAVAFDQSVMLVGGRRLRLEGLATIQDSGHPGVLIVRSGFTAL